MIGIDEAGRGPVLGSMFYAGVSLPENHRVLDNMKDSKQLSTSQREYLYNRLKSTEFAVVEISPAEIDEYSLTELSIRAINQLVADLPDSDTIIIDAPHTSEESFLEQLQESGIEIENLLVEHKADENHKIVSAASVIAKEHRENHVEQLQQNYASYDIGSGYPSDQTTRTFLKQYYRENGVFPTETRLSWSTCEQIREELS